MIWVTAALLTGLASSFHCVAMCGPLAMALPIGRLPRYQRMPGLLLYHASRLFSYSILGLTTGLVGQGIWLADLQRPVSIGTGLLLISWIFITRTHPGTRFGIVTRRLIRPFASLWTSPTLVKISLAGFMNGLLPCGYIYLAMAGALTQSTALEGAIYMLIFGSGTLPALLGIRVMPRLVPMRWRRQGSWAIGILTVATGLLLISRGLGIGSAHQITVHDSEPAPLCRAIPVH